MKQKKYKYQSLIDELIALGCQLPDLYAPNNIKACRFVFSDSKHQNHIPQYMTNPKRMLQDVAKVKLRLHYCLCHALIVQLRLNLSIATYKKHSEIFLTLLATLCLRAF